MEGKELLAQQERKKEGKKKERKKERKFITLSLSGLPKFALIMSFFSLGFYVYVLALRVLFSLSGLHVYCLS